MPGFASSPRSTSTATTRPGLPLFYSRVLGWDVLHSEAEYAMIGDGSISIGFGKVPGYAAPGWPDESRHRSATTSTPTWTISTLLRRRRWRSVPASRPNSPTRHSGACCRPGGHPFDICLKG